MKTIYEAENYKVEIEKGGTMEFTYENGYLPPKVVEMAKKIPGGMRNRIKQFEESNSQTQKRFWAEKVMEIADNSMWITYYQSLAAAEAGRKGGKVGGKKSRGGGRPPAKKPSKEALYRREYRKRIRRNL